MNFTKGETLKKLLRLIASACRSGLLIADLDVRDERARFGCEGECRSFNFEISPLVKSISGFAP
jgi:hypothetical protein